MTDNDPRTTRTTYHAELATLLRQQGVDVVFGLIGDGNLFFVEHFRTMAGSRYVDAVHESNAVMMAAGYATVTNRVGVATVTHGPGLSNVVTPLIECVKSSIPLVLIAGDTRQLDRYSPQKIAQEPLIAATGAGFEQARSPETLASDLSTAFRRAWSEKRPIVLNVPIEHTWVEVAPSSYTPAPRALPAMAPDPDALDTALGILMSVKRPLVLAGKGALDAREPLVELARTIGAPLATTAQAKDLFVGEPADLGIFGSLSTVAAQHVIAEADCIISFGASLNPKTSDDGGLLSGKTVVQVDIDVAAIGNFVPAHAAILGDSALTATTLTRWLREAEREPSSFSGPRTIQRLAEQPRPLGEGSRPGTVDIQTALRHLEEILPADRSVVVDVGRFALYALRLVHAPDARSWLWSGAGFAAIGLGMGAAVGTAAARPDRPTVLLAGDGGFMLGGLNEFTTAVRHGLDVICVVCNDGSYGAEHIQFTGRDLDPSLSLFDWPDFAGMAEALGGTGFRVANEQDLQQLGSVIEGRTGPLLIDLRLDPDRVTSFE
jgi:acetolactate synthase-1/2/3 large subunit